MPIWNSSLEFPDILSADTAEITDYEDIEAFCAAFRPYLDACVYVFGYGSAGLDPDIVESLQEGIYIRFADKLTEALDELNSLAQDWSATELAEMESMYLKNMEIQSTAVMLEIMENLPDDPQEASAADLISGFSLMILSYAFEQMAQHLQEEPESIYDWQFPGHILA